MNSKKIILILVLVIALVCVVSTIALVVSDPVSPNCRRACEHVKAPAGWSDCVAMCEERP